MGRGRKYKLQEKGGKKCIDIKEEITKRSGIEGRLKMINLIRI